MKILLFYKIQISKTNIKEHRHYVAYTTEHEIKKKLTKNPLTINFYSN